VPIRRNAFSHAFVRSTAQRWRICGSPTLSRRRLPRQTSRTDAPAGIGSPRRRGWLMQERIPRSASARSCAAEA
jgi:hypothetical protein